MRPVAIGYQSDARAAEPGRRPPSAERHLLAAGEKAAFLAATRNISGVARREPPIRHEDLTTFVKLPGLTLDESNYWTISELARALRTQRRGLSAV